MYIAGTVCVDALGGYPKTSTVCMRECDIRPCRLPMALISPRCDSRYPIYGNANTVGTGVTAAHDRGDTLSTPPVTKSTEALLLAATVGSRKCAGELGRSDLGISNQLFWRHAFRPQSDVASVESCRAEIDSRPAYPISMSAGFESWTWRTRPERLSRSRCPRSGGGLRSLSI
jgi:hypothetical protein